MSLTQEANLSSTYDLISKLFDAATWVVIIVTAYLILDAIHMGGDDDPDGWT